MKIFINWDNCGRICSSGGGSPPASSIKTLNFSDSRRARIRVTVPTPAGHRHCNSTINIFKHNFMVTFTYFRFFTNDTVDGFLRWNCWHFLECNGSVLLPILGFMLFKQGLQRCCENEKCYGVAIETHTDFFSHFLEPLEATDLTL